MKMKKHEDSEADEQPPYWLTFLAFYLGIAWGMMEEAWDLLKARWKK